MWVEAHVSLWGGQAHREHPQRLAGAKTGLRPPMCWMAYRQGRLGQVLGSGCVLSLGGIWKCRHMDDLSSSPEPSTSLGGRAGSCFNACRTFQGAQCRGRPAGCSRPGGLSASSGHSSCSSRARLVCAASPDLTEASPTPA